MTTLTYLNPIATSVLLLIEFKDINMAELKNALNKLLQGNFLKIIVIHINLSINVVKAFNFFPFNLKQKILEFNLFETKFDESDFDKDSNLNGAPLRLVAYDDPPKSFIKDSDLLRGYEGMIMRLVCTKMKY